MKSKRIYIIKNMVCQRCIEAVEEIFNKHPTDKTNVVLGKVETLILEDFDDELLANNLRERGFEVVKSKEEILLEKTKVAVVKLVHYLSENPNITTSVWLEKELGESYQKISRTFSKVNNITLEKFIIQHKVEKTKELIQYGQLSFEDIACNLGYKSLSHLSAQFKDLAGMSLSEFKKSENRKRNKLEDL